MTKFNDWSVSHAISPLDGRYSKITEPLRVLWSESGLIHARLIVEVKWLLHLSSELPDGPRFDETERAALLGFCKNLPGNAALRVKEFEAETNHDVKACEYYLREVLDELGVDPRNKAFIHFALTSEDVNNLAYAVLLRDQRDDLIKGPMHQVLEQLVKLMSEHKNLAMLSRTHGQTASPTTLGKEFAVFAHRLSKVYRALAVTPIQGKLNGAVGNFNAHVCAYPEIDWQKLSRKFVSNQLKLAYNPCTTQIENHDSMVLLVSEVGRFNQILLGLCRDIWGYISLGYFRQKTKAGEVGSSTMPHKVNPIDFENAEGNIGLANALGFHFQEKLPVSRFQRDLSDSTVQRSLGSFFGYSVLAMSSLLKGLGKLEVEAHNISRDLDAAVEVLAEPIQTAMRRYGVMDAYERLKEKTRDKAVDLKGLHDLIDECAELPAAVKASLKSLEPRLYIGLAAQIVDDVRAEVCRDVD